MQDCRPPLLGQANRTMAVGATERIACRILGRDAAFRYRTTHRLSQALPRSSLSKRLLSLPLLPPPPFPNPISRRRCDFLLPLNGFQRHLPRGITAFIPFHAKPAVGGIFTRGPHT